MSAGVARVARAVALAAALPAIAAPAVASSRYSLRGEGEPVLPAGAETRALGGAEAASDEPGISANPASLVFADRTRFHGSWITEWVRTQETLADGFAVRKEYEGLVPDLGLVFPVPGGVRIGTGLLVERRQDGRIERDAVTPDGRPYRQTFEASGNLLRIPALIARAAGPVAAGAGLDVVLANSELRWRNDFPTGTGFVDSDDRDETGLKNVTWRAGVRAPLGERVAVGAWGAWPRKLTGDRRLENASPQDTTGTLELPVESETARRFGVGVEGSPAPGWRVVADWVHEAWEDVDAPLSIGTFVDVDRVSMGVEWSREGRRGFRLPIRAGYRTEPLHTRDGRGREIREHAITGGTGFVFADGRGELDWFAEYGWRGEAGESEFHEQFVRFGVTLTGFEEWTRRRPPESDTEDW